MTIFGYAADELEAALDFAWACADIARVRPAPTFQWAAPGLVVEVPGAGTGLVQVPDGTGTEAEPSPGDHDALLAAAGAAAALVASALTASADGPDDLRWTCPVGAVLPPARSARPADGEWLGYAPVRQGWIGLVLPLPDAQAIWADAVALLGVRQMPPLAAAALLQHLGVAAFPARRLGPGVGTAAETPPPLPQGAERPAVLRPADAATLPAVRGRRVLDLGRLVAAPFAAQILSDLGADVRRVRPPGDATPAGTEADVIDLATPAGASEMAGLVAAADLVTENFRPRGWAIVQAAIAGQPRRRAAIRGFDADSPLRNWKMYGFLVEAFFGIGRRGCDPGGRAMGGAMWDRLCGVVTAAAAIQQLAAGTRAAPVSEISQVRLARLWATARRADVSSPDKERHRR